MGVDLVKVGEAVRRIRQRQNLTLEDVKQRAEVDTGNLSKIERGSVGWSFETISAIAQRGLRVSLSELFAEAEGSSSARVASVTLPVVALEDLLRGSLTSALKNASETTRTTANVGPKAFAFRYKGGAMPERNGELIIIDPDITPTFGQHVLVQTEDEVLFRKLDEEGGKSHLYPSNRQHPVVSLKRTHKILGVARQAIRDL